jgi:adenylate cyclase
MVPTIEIERKFWVETPPQDLGCQELYLEVGYTRDAIRLRKYGPQFMMCLKEGQGLSRKEWEVEVPEWVFDKLWPHTEELRVCKTRHFLQYGLHTLELDEYHGPYEGLWILECEFISESEAAQFDPPSWATEEVTGKEEFTTAGLLMCGMPKSVSKSSGNVIQFPER